ncbi:MAG TPA: DUF1553 domain-containing protein, partial [Planctomycetaceae bacterium]|nr:DUF1553 domain-containing protein [Planctomycetaceae bacterium]
MNSAALVVALTLFAAQPDATFPRAAAVFEQHCVRCHNADETKGGLDLSSAKTLRAGGESGVPIEAGDPDSSLLIEMITGDKPQMPKKAPPLSAKEIAAVRDWIKAGARFPDETVLRPKQGAWWSLEPLTKPVVPEVRNAWVRTPVDAFVLTKLHEKGLAPSPEADCRTLIRRLSFDLLGLPPTPAEVEAFVNDPAPDAYEQLVDRLLESPHYGERWARHWLDAVHYGDTHGYDKDKIRPNAWPYRDYVVRAFNEDKPYARFVREQLAGDYLFPDDRDGIVATGFIAAGPFDWVGQIELGEGTLDKQITRNLDRDDMVSVAMNTFSSLTAQCARCHNHKFDPISQEDYYSLQAVFAGIDRADRPYETNPQIAAKRLALKQALVDLESRRAKLLAEINQAAGPEFVAIESQLAELSKPQSTGERPEFGYHSAISPIQNATKWVQLDLGQPVQLEHLVYVACHDTFNNIGAGFGFPVRYRIEVSNDPQFKADVTVVEDHTDLDVPNPGVKPQSITVKAAAGRFIRITATKLAPRQNDFIFSLAEVLALTPDGRNAAAGATVTSLDSIEAPVRWTRKNLVDGYYYGRKQDDNLPQIVKLNERRRELLETKVTAEQRAASDALAAEEKAKRAELAALPAPGTVYAVATEFAPAGSFTPTHGKPREIRILQRGSEKLPGREVGPGTVGCVAGLPSRFEFSSEAPEGARRAALAEWVVDARNPLTWRSIVNRIWGLHFGRGIVDSPNDFGRMGSLPTHPELLDWLAVEFRDGKQSFKELHRLILKSSVYRQSAASNDAFAKLDGGNQYLWRMNRTRLDAEEIRDAVLAVSGKLDPRLGGPGYYLFGFKDDHSPHYTYQDHNPDDPASHRRSIYRFVVRSVPDPFMETLDCADPSLIVARRNETLTALQALALLNNKFMVRMSEHFADRTSKDAADVAGRINAMFRLALSRAATPEEIATLKPIAEQQGLASVARIV